jgi:hypothetical protein
MIKKWLKRWLRGDEAVTTIGKVDPKDTPKAAQTALMGSAPKYQWGKKAGKSLYGSAEGKIKWPPNNPRSTSHTLRQSGTPQVILPSNPDILPFIVASEMLSRPVTHYTPEPVFGGGDSGGAGASDSWSQPSDSFVLDQSSCDSASETKTWADYSTSSCDTSNSWDSGSNYDSGGSYDSGSSGSWG